jgi:hypothetical protein
MITIEEYKAGVQRLELVHEQRNQMLDAANAAADKQRAAAQRQFNAFLAAAMSNAALTALYSMASADTFEAFIAHLEQTDTVQQ